MDLLQAVIALAVPVLGLFIGIIGYLVKQRDNFMKERFAIYDEHLLECGKKNVRFATIEENQKQTLHEVSSLRRTSTWIGDCLMRIGAKSNIELPNRPE